MRPIARQLDYAVVTADRPELVIETVAREARDCPRTTRFLLDVQRAIPADRHVDRFADCMQAGQGWLERNSVTVNHGGSRCLRCAHVRIPVGATMHPLYVDTSHRGHV